MSAQYKRIARLGGLSPVRWRPCPRRGDLCVKQWDARTRTIGTVPGACSLIGESASPASSATSRARKWRTSPVRCRGSCRLVEAARAASGPTYPSRRTPGAAPVSPFGARSSRLKVDRDPRRVDMRGSRSQCRPDRRCACSQLRSRTGVVVPLPRRHLRRPGNRWGHRRVGRVGGVDRRCAIGTNRVGVAVVSGTARGLLRGGPLGGG